MSPEARGPASHLDDDTCLDLVQGLVDEGARRRALDHARTCAACESRLRETAATHERGRAQAAEWLAREAPAGAAAFADDAPAGRRAFAVVPRTWLAAAGFVVVVGATWMAWSARGPAAPPAPQAAALPAVKAADLMLTRAPGGTDSLVMSGIAAYGRGDFARAADLLGRTEDAEGYELMRRVYLANAQLQLGRAEDAARTLEHVINVQLPEPWRGECEWTRFVALTRIGQRAKADSLLQELVRIPGPVGERAQHYQSGLPRRR